ncbi:TPA: hypothetical protein HA251_06735 [Candidatus Woesearchaeota archaeon]|nr:hypothetical protein [Candidatus Woesearchaeota archaeon]
MATTSQVNVTKTEAVGFQFGSLMRTALDIARKNAMEDAIEQATQEKKFDSTGGVLAINSGLFHPENDFTVAFATGYLAAKGYGVVQYGAQTTGYPDMTGRGGKAKILVMEVGKYS